MIGHFKIYTEYVDCTNNAGLAFAVDEHDRILKAEVFCNGVCAAPKLEELATMIRREFRIGVGKAILNEENQKTDQGKE